MNNEGSILICGRLGKNPELKFTKNQKPICFLSVAESIDNQEKPLWHNVVVWGNQAEACNLYFKKGEQIFVQGRISNREYKNKEGLTKQIIEIKADVVGFPFKEGN